MTDSDIALATMRKRGKWLCRAGWGLFGMSMLLPALKVFDWMQGWACLWIVFGIAKDVIAGNEGLTADGWAYYYVGLAMSNGLLLASPLLARLFRRNPRRLRRTGLMLSTAGLYAAAFLPLGGLEAMRSLHVGFYAWALSFALVSVGILHLALQGSTNELNQKPTSTVKTEEEQAALRELEEYLGGGTQPIPASCFHPEQESDPARLQTLRRALA